MLSHIHVTKGDVHTYLLVLKGGENHLADLKKRGYQVSPIQFHHTIISSTDLHPNVQKTNLSLHSHVFRSQHSKYGSVLIKLPKTEHQCRNTAGFPSERELTQMRRISAFVHRLGAALHLPMLHHQEMPAEEVRESIKERGYRINKIASVSVSIEVKDHLWTARTLKLPSISEERLTPEEHRQIKMLHDRLDIFESLLGAPDRHSGNYLEVGALTSKGVYPVRHGFDYEHFPDTGLLSGETSVETLFEQAMTHPDPTTQQVCRELYPLLSKGEIPNLRRERQTWKRVN